MEKKLTKIREWILIPILAAMALGLIGVGFAPQIALAQQATATPTAGQATETPQAGQATATPQAGQATATPQATQQIPQTGQQQGQTGQVSQAQTIERGNVGVFSPLGFNEDTFSITKVDRRSVGSQPVNFALPLVRIASTQGNFPNVLTYVFFNVRPGSIEKQQNRDKGVGIWFRSNDGGAWQRCENTFIVNGTTASQMGMDINLQGRDETRIACLVTRYNATYGIGVLRDNARNVDKE